MVNDTIVEEIHQFRTQLLSQHGGNLAAYFATLVQKQQEQPERYASFTQPAGSHVSATPNPRH